MIIYPLKMVIFQFATLTKGHFPIPWSYRSALPSQQYLGGTCLMDGVLLGDGGIDILRSEPSDPARRVESIHLGGSHL